MFAVFKFVTIFSEILPLSHFLKTQNSKSKKYPNPAYRKHKRKRTEPPALHQPPSPPQPQPDNPPAKHPRPSLHIPGQKNPEKAAQPTQAGEGVQFPREKDQVVCEGACHDAVEGVPIQIDGLQEKIQAGEVPPCE